MEVSVNRAFHRALKISFLYSSKSIPEYERLKFFRSFGIFVRGNNMPGSTFQYDSQCLLGSRMQRLLCTEVEKPKETPTGKKFYTRGHITSGVLSCQHMVSESRALDYADESVKQWKIYEAVQELYQTIVKTLDSKNLPTNTLRDSFLEKCKNTEDVKLAFDILEKLRIFKTAILCQPANWPKQITLAVASACVRGNAPDIGLRTLWRHNVYGLTPNISAAHSLLLYSKEKKDIALMKKILGTMEKNFLKPRSKTADIVLSICNDTQQWKLTTIYAKKFLEDGVKLYHDAYDILICCAAKLGNAQEVRRIQELRLASGFKHTVPSAFACAKAYLLEDQPQEAAEVIFKLNQENLSEAKKNLVYEELELLVDKWPEMVISRKDKGHRKAVFTELKDRISVMFNSLSNMGFEVLLNVDERYCSKSKNMKKLRS